LKTSIPPVHWTPTGSSGILLIITIVHQVLAENVPQRRIRLRRKKYDGGLQIFNGGVAIKIRIDASTKFDGAGIYVRFANRLGCFVSELVDIMLYTSSGY
jgi:hypothetical protein